MKYVDLHTHTIYSDGNQTPSQNVIDGVKLGLDIIAVTDHDTIEGVYEAVKEAKNHNINVVTGVEISTRKYHILGYGFDLENKEFREFLEYSQEIQKNIVRRRVEKLQEIRIPVTLEKVIKYSPKSRLGKNNIAFALMKDSACKKYIGKKSFLDVFNSYLKKGSPSYNIKKPKEPSSKEAIEAIHNANGKVILAHPFKDLESITELERLIKEGIDGIEVQPRYGKKNGLYKKYALDNNLIITYGSDFHGSMMPQRPMFKRDSNKINEATLRLLNGSCYV